jgi:hypothetical protein
LSSPLSFRGEQYRPAFSSLIVGHWLIEGSASGKDAFQKRILPGRRHSRRKELLMDHNHCNPQPEKGELHYETEHKR